MIYLSPLSPLQDVIPITLAKLLKRFVCGEKTFTGIDYHFCITRSFSPSPFPSTLLFISFSPLFPPCDDLSSALSSPILSRPLSPSRGEGEGEEEREREREGEEFPEALTRPSSPQFTVIPGNSRPQTADDTSSPAPSRPSTVGRREGRGEKSNGNSMTKKEKRLKEIQLAQMVPLSSPILSSLSIFTFPPLRSRLLSSRVSPLS